MNLNLNMMRSSLMKFLFLCSLLIICASFVTARAPAINLQADTTVKSRITTASSVRVRAAAQTSSTEVARLPLCTIVRELEQSAGKEKVGTAEDFWYRISAPNGVEGWVFGALTTPFTPARRDEIYLHVANERLKNESLNFNDASELFTFLDRAVKETSGRNTPAELELLRLLALQKSLALIPTEKQAEPPYQAWTKAQEQRIVYSEPSGQWYVRADSFWALERKYRALPIGERIAWEASKIALPGECEGYLPCHLDYEAQTRGEYLKLYPRGAHTSAALDGISESFKYVLDDFKSSDNAYDVPKEERAGFQRQIAALRATLARVADAKSALAVKQLDIIARHFR